MADSKKQNPSTAKSSTANNPVVEKPADKLASNTDKTKTMQPSTAAKTASSAKTATSTTNKTVGVKKVEKSVQKNDQKEKRSGGGVAFLALLCALGALGLSGYNFYEQNLSPKKAQTQETMLSGVNDIKGNVTEFSGVITSLQQEVKDFKAKQSQYITKDTLDSAVKESVSSAVTNLPDLPQIGPSTLRADGSLSENSDSAEASKPAESSIPAQGSLPAEALNTDGSSKSSPSIEDAQENSSEAVPEVAQNDEKSAWSWGRAKQDFKNMFKGLVTVEKIDQQKK